MVLSLLNVMMNDAFVYTPVGIDTIDPISVAELTLIPARIIAPDMYGEARDTRYVPLGTVTLSVSCVPVADDSVAVHDASKYLSWTGVI